MPFTTQLENLSQLRAAVMLYSPKDEHGDLAMPYRRWLAQLDKDILKAMKYLQSIGEKFTISNVFVPLSPSDPQESDLSPEDDED